MLEYERKLAPHEQTIMRNAMRLNKPLPKSIRDAPELEPENEFYYFAFFDLATCRNFEMGNIPYFEVIKYAHNVGEDHDGTLILWNVIHIVDNWVLNEISKEIAKSAPTNGKGNGKGAKSR